MMWKRMAVGVGVAALTLGLLAVPSATASEVGQPTPKTVITVPPQRVPQNGFFIPQRVAGDADFKAHGPQVDATAELKVTGGGKNLVVVLTMRAVETQPDRTEARGTSGEHLIFLAPQGECIQSTDLGRFDEMHYIDTDHANDVFNGSAANFVSVWNFVGDTSGNEAGTRTGVSIGTDFITVTTVPC